MLAGGMTAAAQTLRVTQPAITRLIRDLETELRVSLFFRKGNRITPTAEATAFLVEVERSYLGMEQLKAFAANLRQSRAGSLRIAGLPAMALDFLPYCLAAFGRDHQGISVLLEGIPSHMVIEQVASGQIELGFTERLSEHPMLNVTPIKTFAVAVLPKGNRLAKFRTLSADQISNENLVLLSHRSYLRHAIEDFIYPHPRHAGIVETSTSAVACAMVQRGLGVTIVEPFTAVSFLNRDVEVRLLKPRIEAAFSMITAKHRPPSQLVEKFSMNVLRLVGAYLAPVFGRQRSIRPATVAAFH